MPRKKMSRTASMGLGASFGRCFGTGEPLGLSFFDDAEVGCYDRVGSEDDGEAEQVVPPRVTQLGTPTQRAGREAPKRALSFSSILRDSKGNLSSRVKEACEQVMDVARKSRPHLNQLFVGNQLLTHVTSSSLVRPDKALKPSTGFVDNSIRNAEITMRER